MIREIVKIDEEKCNGCGLCVPNCAEGALQIVDGKARLIGEIYCDGLGACLGHCPEDAITIEKREADDFDEEAVEALLQGPEVKEEAVFPAHSGGCPGSALRSLVEHEAPAPHAGGCPGSALRTLAEEDGPDQEPLTAQPSQLTHWPVQLMLVPPAAPFLKGRDIVVSADCAPFAVADYHQRYLKNRAVVVGCPKLDDLGFYREKLVHLLREARPASITVLRMEVPCCSGIAHAVMEAREKAAPDCPLEVHTIGIQGDISVDRIPVHA